MKVALIGYAQSGRSTLYRAAAQGLAKGDVTAVPVPDTRFDTIVEKVKPKKASAATVVLQDDVEGAQGAGKMFSQRAIDAAKKAELLLHVVRAFDSPMAPFHAEVNPLRDQEAVDVELVLLDLQIVENRLERLQKSMTVKNPGSPDYLEKRLFDRIHGPLSEGVALREMELDEEEQTIVRNYQFLSAKPIVVAFNVSESQAAAGTPELLARCEALKAKGQPAFWACATLEEEIAQLDAADQPAFLEMNGLAEPASHKVVRACYEAMDLITFFTVGEHDTRAWPLRRGSNAVKAAHTIHTDIAKGFIRAEVVSYADWEKAGGWDAAHSAGLMRLEGKEYVVNDGDCLHIRNKS